MPVREAKISTSTLANAHSLFTGLKLDPSYLRQLDIGDIARRELMEARKLCRAALRQAAQGIAARDALWQDEWRSAAKRPLRGPVVVKFMTQGSFAYETINDPPRDTQEIDLDDGMYVPVEFLSNGEPALAARALFDFVVETLTPLAENEGWLEVAPKTNCVRVRLWKGAHLDIPIYSVPRERFVMLSDSLAKSHHAVLTRSMMHDSYRLPSDKIMLARQDGTWIPSDPQKLQDWVDGRVEQYGPVFRRVARFFKGWRDYEWQSSDLSSLCLMCAVDEGLRRYSNDAGGLPSEERDDVLVLEVARRLPDILDDKVCNPVLDSCLNEWDAPAKAEILNKASSLKTRMSSAIESTGDAYEVVRKLRLIFGERIPNRPDAVKIASEIAAVVYAEPRSNPAPNIIPSTSG